MGIVRKGFTAGLTSSSQSIGVPFGAPLSSSRPLLEGSDQLRPMETRRISKSNRVIGKSVIYAKLPTQGGKANVLEKFSEDYRNILLKMHARIESEFKSDPDNLVIMFYFCLTCLLMRKIEHCKQIISLAKSIYQMSFKSRGFVVLDYYMVKIRNIETLVSALDRI